MKLMSLKLITLMWVKVLMRIDPKLPRASFRYIFQVRLNRTRLRNHVICFVYRKPFRTHHIILFDYRKKVILLFFRKLKKLRSRVYKKKVCDCLWNHLGIWGP